MSPKGRRGNLKDEKVRRSPNGRRILEAVKHRRPPLAFFDCNTYIGAPMNGALTPPQTAELRKLHGSKIKSVVATTGAMRATPNRTQDDDGERARHRSMMRAKQIAGSSRISIERT